MTTYQQNGNNDTQGSIQRKQYADLVEQLDLMIRARYPLLYLITVEEEPVEEVLREVANHSQPQRQVLFWDIVRGWSDNSTDKGSVMAALLRISKADGNTPVMFVLRDLHPFIKNPTNEKSAPIVRELRNLARELKRTRKTIVTTSHSLDLPEELMQEVTVVDFPLPSVTEIDRIIQQLVVPDKLNISGLGREQLVKA
jgi:hypothetical protein